MDNDRKRENSENLKAFDSKINYAIIKHKKNAINRAMKEYLLNIKIINSNAVLSVSDSNKKTGMEFKKLEWTDQRDLSEKLLGKIDLLLRKNHLAINNISKITFSGKECGFMTEQVGKTTANILNFGLDLKTANAK